MMAPDTTVCGWGDSELVLLRVDWSLEFAVSAFYIASDQSVQVVLQSPVRARWWLSMRFDGVHQVRHDAAGLEVSLERPYVEVTGVLVGTGARWPQAHIELGPAVSDAGCGERRIIVEAREVEAVIVDDWRRLDLEYVRPGGYGQLPAAATGKE